MGKYTYHIKLDFDNNEDTEVDFYTRDIYYSNQHYDKLKITNKGLYLKCNRVKDRDLSKILTDFRSTFNTQITKSLSFFIATNGFISTINSIKIEKDELNIKKAEYIYPYEKLLQPFNNNLNNELIIDRDKLDALFNSDLKSQSLMMSLSLWLKGATLELAGDGFDCFWTSFNSLYTFITQQDKEFDKLKEMRRFILSNRDLFVDSSSFFDSFDDKELRKLRWREMILNDYEDEKKTKAFRDFLFRYKDYRINKVFLEILPYRKTFLSNAGYLGEVEKHINTAIKSRKKDNHEVLCLYMIKYCYFIRNKYFHGEKLDPTIHLIKTDEISELKIINKLFAIFLKELIMANSKY
ncbi:hypothetical protein ABEP50_22595 [Priestia megaterium]